MLFGKKDISDVIMPAAPSVGPMVLNAASTIIKEQRKNKQEREARRRERKAEERKDTLWDWKIEDRERQKKKEKREDEKWEWEKEDRKIKKGEHETDRKYLEKERERKDRSWPLELARKTMETLSSYADLQVSVNKAPIAIELSKLGMELKQAQVKDARLKEVAKQLSPLIYANASGERIKEVAGRLRNKYKTLGIPSDLQSIKKWAGTYADGGQYTNNFFYEKLKEKGVKPGEYRPNVDYETIFKTQVASEISKAKDYAEGLKAARKLMGKQVNLTDMNALFKKFRMDAIAAEGEIMGAAKSFINEAGADPALVLSTIQRAFRELRPDYDPEDSESLLEPLTDAEKLKIIEAVRAVLSRQQNTGSTGESQEQAQGTIGSSIGGVPRDSAGRTLNEVVGQTTKAAAEREAATRKRIREQPAQPGPFGLGAYTPPLYK